MSTTAPPAKIIVLLNEEEHATLKGIVKETRRTLGQEMAYRAFQAIRKPARKKARATS